MEMTRYCTSFDSVNLSSSSSTCSSISTSNTNLPLDKAVVDGALMMEALAVRADIFTENLFELRQRDPSTMVFPYTLKIREDKKSLPVFLNKAETGVLQYSGLKDHYQRVAAKLGWES